MSTNDVPGAKKENQDELGVGDWAEADGGQSLIFVKSAENDRVIYEVYDLSHEPVLQYTDAMKIEDFKKQFTWDPKSRRGSLRSIRWTWHDKRPFPWDKVIKAGARDGARFASAEDELENAEKIQKSRERLKKGKKPTGKRDPHTGAPEMEEDDAVKTAEVDDGEESESAAATVAKQRKLEAKPFDPKMHEHKVEQQVGKTGVGIWKRIQGALDGFRNPPEK